MLLENGVGCSGMDKLVWIISYKLQKYCTFCVRYHKQFCTNGTWLVRLQVLCAQSTKIFSFHISVSLITEWHVEFWYCFLHDNIHSHTAITQSLLGSFKWELFDHSPYSSDLDPNDLSPFFCYNKWIKYKS